MKLLKKGLVLSLIVLWAGVAPARQAAEEDLGQVLGGAMDAPIKLEVFSDFQCPACRQLYLGTIRPVLQDYASKGKVCVIYHEFPLAMHPYARDAARYSEAAHRLGQMKWLPVVDALFESQPAWSVDGKVESAVSRAMSPEDFQKVKNLVLDPSINETLNREIALGQKREVKSTPTMFVHYIGREQKVEGGIPYPVLKQFFDQIVR